MNKKDKKRILKEDIADLKVLIKQYSKECKFDKASNCMKELEELKQKLKEV